MNRIRRFTYRFVTSVPAQLEEGILYVSLEYLTAMHLCACGCRNETITPLAPAKWSITFDGASVALSPSIGNWSFPCRSHYWITSGGHVQWARTWSTEEVAAGRRDRPSVIDSTKTGRGRRSMLNRWFMRRRR